jgi:hypothetical protein
MRFSAFLGSVGLVCAMGSVAHAQWLDDFDSYAPGPLAAQSAWEEWTGSSGVDANVTVFQSFTTPNSVVIITNNDVVYDFALLPSGRPSSGVWTTSIKTYLPSGTTGIGWYILMNDYPTNLHWSVQTTFDTTQNRVIDGAARTRIKYDQWVSLVISIDLDNDRYDSWYGNKPLAINRQWTDVGGQTVISAVDLYGDAGGLTGLYYDNARIEKTAGGPLVLNASPNPTSSGATLDFFAQSPVVTPGDPAALFLWSVNGSFFSLPLLIVSFDANLEWNFSTTVPPGVTGIDIGFKMFAAPSGGRILLSNEKVVVFQ